MKKMKDFMKIHPLEKMESKTQTDMEIFLILIKMANKILHCQI
jgi:hypothetical protein